MSTRTAALPLIIAAVAGMSACSTPRTDDSVALSRASLQATEQRIAQVGFGAGAQFVSCVGPACPLPTPKTLALPVAGSAPAAAQAAVDLGTPHLNPNGSPR